MTCRQLHDCSWLQSTLLPRVSHVDNFLLVGDGRQLRPVAGGCVVEFEGVLARPPVAPCRSRVDSSGTDDGAKRRVRALVLFFMASVVCLGERDTLRKRRFKAFRTLDVRH